MLFSIASAHLDAAVSAEAAMLQTVIFKLGGGRSFEPFARSLWSDDASSSQNLPAHLRWLGAEFVCVPFGVGGLLEEVSPAWRGLAIQAENDPPHGLSANQVWHVLHREPDRLTFELHYPADCTISCLRRTIRASDEGPWLDLALTIESRATTRTSVGLHPIVSLDQPTANLSLKADFELGLTYPAAVPGDSMMAEVGGTFASLSAVPGKDGKSLDLSRLPAGEAIEDVLLLCGMRDGIQVDFLKQRAALRIDWDRTLLPSCQIWISDRALQSPPWNGRYRGLGIEPVAAAFDFADQISIADNPITRRGFPTCLTVEPDRPVTIRYRLEAVDLRSA